MVRNKSMRSMVPSTCVSNSFFFFVVVVVLVVLAMAADQQQLNASSFHGSLFHLHSLAKTHLYSSSNISNHLHHLQSLDRLRHGRLLIPSAQSYPLGGIADPNIAGLYFTELKIGTPPSKYYVQVDTGSDLLWLNCASCKTCPTSSDLGVRLAQYNPHLSSTSSILYCGDLYCSASRPTDCPTGQPCVYQQGYGDGSSSEGYFVRDAFQLDIVAGNHSMKNATATLAFGCGTTQGGELEQQDQALDGIMGLGQSKLSAISQLVDQKQAPGIFAHCLEGQGDGGGILVIGQVQATGLVYTSIISNQPHYNVNLQSITVDGVTIQIDSSVSALGQQTRGTIIDSGTTLAYIADGAYQHLLKAILGRLGKLSQDTHTWQGMTCVPYTGRCDLWSGGFALRFGMCSVDDGFPSVILTFEGKGAVMVIKPHEYLVQAQGSPGNGWCIGFQAPSPNSLDLNILGDLILKDRLVVYDLEQQRIGWVDYNCSSNVTVISSLGQVEHAWASSIPSAGHTSGSSISNSGIICVVAISCLCLFLHVSLILMNCEFIFTSKNE